ncbi:hypothetical protein AB4510_06120 [Vibrio sp. 10N.222.54.B12]|uniref:hypothetical protein n=2 Tax=unclassified Vibrio TaxID=2614977 RepID=UPI00354D1B60
MKQPYLVVTHAEGFEPESYLVYATDEDMAWERLLHWLETKQLLDGTTEQYLDHCKLLDDMQRTAVEAPDEVCQFDATYEALDFEFLEAFARDSLPETEAAVLSSLMEKLKAAHEARYC